MMKKTLLSISIMSLLSACGGSDSASETPIETPTSNEYRVIDGYLADADVCVIAQGTTDCIEIGKTDEEGLVTIPDTYTAGTIVATAVAGQTSDEDSVGNIAKTYQMVADISADGSKVITPYTTLDVLDDTKTMADIAAELGLDEALISGDYVASTSTDQAKAHALARGLVTQLSADQTENDITELTTAVTKINDYIDNTLINDGVDLDSVVISLASDGNAIHSNLISSLSDFLVSDTTFTVFSISKSYFEEDGGESNFILNEGKMTLNGDFGPFDYEINDNTLSITFEEDGKTLVESDEFIYASDSIALAVSLSETDLSVIYNNDTKQYNEYFEEENLVGNTYYYIIDDAATTPDPTMVAVKFSDGTALLTEEDGTSQTVTWDVGTYSYTRQADPTLNLYLSEENSSDSDLALEPDVVDQNISLMYNKLEGGSKYILVFTDKNLAENVLNDWKNLSK